MPSTTSWPWIQKLGLLSSFIFLFLFIITASEATYFLPNPRVWTDGIAQFGIHFSATYIWQIEGDFIRQVRSDSLGLWIHVGNILILSFLVGLGLLISLSKNWNYAIVYSYFRKLILYYLIFQMLFYGFNKVFKCQFFLPEPNTLFTPVGEVSKDLLFWTVMGSSYGYTVFGGILELLAAGLLLLKKTRMVGALLCAGILTNIVAINFAFNISVKFYSIFFWLLTLVWLLPYGNMLYHFFIHQQLKPPTLWQANNSSKRLWLKVIFIWCLLFESLLPYIQSQNFNDDHFPRPAFHGAYDIIDQQTNSNWHRAFVHRRGYFIFQDKQGQMYDYQFEYDDTQQLFRLTDIVTKKSYHFYYQQHKMGLQLQGKLKEQKIDLLLKKINLSELPLLKHELDWTIDALSSP